MYTFLPDLTLDSIGLIDTDSWIWIGIKPDAYNVASEPVDRTQTRQFRRCDVYLYNGKRVFSFRKDARGKELDFYLIPDNDLLHIQKKD